MGMGRAPPQQLLQGAHSANIYWDPGPGQVLGMWRGQDKASLAPGGLLIPSTCRALCQELTCTNPFSPPVAPSEGGITKPI